MKIYMMAGLLAAAIIPAPLVAKEAKPPSVKQLANNCKKDGNACIAAAQALLSDNSTPKNFTEGVRLATIGCEQYKLADACLIGGKALISSNVPENLDKGVAMTNKICTMSAPDRCIQANQIYLDSNAKQKTLSFWYGGSNHHSDVYRPLKALCEQGNAAACKANGDVFYLKNTVNDGAAYQTNMLAIQSYRSACDKSDAYSCSRLVELYSNDIPKQRVTPDLQSARAFAAKACTLGQKQHCNNATSVAGSSANEIDASLPYQEQMLVAELALRNGKTKMALDALNRMAAEKRDEANYRLGILYLTGDAGVKANRSTGYYYLEQSGYPEAALLRAKLAVQDNDATAYNKYMDKAYWAGSKEAEVWWLNKQRAYLDAAEARSKRMIADARENDRQKAAYEAELINRAMNNYYQPRDKEPMVCGLFREGGGMVNKCLSRDYYTKKYGG
ncbi:hypothetical protein [Blastomonas sp. AAP53]|uniref:hypothetical protein n=1 Tax=Blastomonas sp. AAP53 TaxID=1248760 RepID=UPI0012674871|nr:hypothetical protein [Blastomonas sp. AAP53]